MPINQQDVKIGHCYATLSNQHRRVLSIDNAEVIYESWGGNVQNFKGHLTRTKVSLDAFANAVEREIPCPPQLSAT
jgi:hypothetical protein